MYNCFELFKEKKKSLKSTNGHFLLCSSFYFSNLILLKFSPFLVCVKNWWWKMQEAWFHYENNIIRILIWFDFVIYFLLLLLLMLDFDCYSATSIQPFFFAMTVDVVQRIFHRIKFEFTNVIRHRTRKQTKCWRNWRDLFFGSMHRMGIHFGMNLGYKELRYSDFCIFSTCIVCVTIWNLEKYFVFVLLSFTRLELFIHTSASNYFIFLAFCFCFVAIFWWFGSTLVLKGEQFNLHRKLFPLKFSSVKSKSCYAKMGFFSLSRSIIRVRKTKYAFKMANAHSVCVDIRPVSDKWWITTFR